MPTYTLKAPDGTIEEHICTIAEMERLQTLGYAHVHRTSPELVSIHGSNISKTPDGYRDLLKQIKSESGRSNTIKT